MITHCKYFLSVSLQKATENVRKISSSTPHASALPLFNWTIHSTQPGACLWGPAMESEKLGWNLNQKCDDFFHSCKTNQVEGELLWRVKCAIVKMGRRSNRAQPFLRHGSQDHNR